ncbi:MAG: hypothetical protein N4A38_02130 [Candidatus Gracilibacteria bacterium]|nr:hypothetical protein [Candidatus Gracilibacteria bacterium]
MNKNKITALKDLIISAESSIENAKAILKEIMDEEGIKDSSLKVNLSTTGLNSYTEADMKIVEGVFTGEEMLGSDGNKYPIAANYASKSKLVQGDKLKLTIDPTGRMTYKQIEPIERETKIGILAMDKDKYQVMIDGKAYNLLTAAVTHYRANIGDSITVIIPKGKKATYAAVEGIVPNN